jgi:arsenate reductase
LLDAEGVAYRYREYRQEPLDAAELRRLLRRLGVGVRDVLRRNDRAWRELALTGDEPEAELIDHMAAHPTLLQRPIGVAGERAVVGRPVERLLELVSG